MRLTIPIDGSTPSRGSAAAARCRLRTNRPLRLSAASLADGFSRRLWPRYPRSGAIFIVGGNNRGYTRTMTTAIALETSKGDLSFAPALGIILITLSMMVSGTSLFIGRAP